MSNAVAAGLGESTARPPVGGTATTGQTVPGTGMMKGRSVDPWGIAQNLTDAVGYTGAVAGGIGRRVTAGGQLLVGLLLIGGSAVLLGWLFMGQTDAGRGVKRAAGRAGKAVRTAVVLAPK